MTIERRRLEAFYVFKRRNAFEQSKSGVVTEKADNTNPLSIKILELGGSN